MALLTPKQNPADLAMTNLTFSSKKRDRDCACTPELQRFACLREAASAKAGHAGVSRDS
jgi:hypothetical protein